MTCKDIKKSLDDVLSDIRTLLNPTFRYQSIEIISILVRIQKRFKHKRGKVSMEVETVINELFNELKKTLYNIKSKDSNISKFHKLESLLMNLIQIDDKLSVYYPIRNLNQLIIKK